MKCFLPHKVAEEASCSLQFAIDRSTINMESKNNSCEKLVDVEAGLTSPKKLTNVPFLIRHHYDLPDKYRNRLIILSATLLLGILCWQMYEAIRNEKFRKSIESQDSESEKLELPLVQEDSRMQEITEELYRLKNTLKEMEKKIDQQDQISTTTELPAPTYSPPNFDENVQNSELDLFKILLEQGNSDDTESSSSDTTIPPHHIPEFQIPTKNISQDLDESDSFSPILVADPIDETDSKSLRWSFSFRFGGAESEEAASSKESNLTERKESEVAASTETESASPEEESIPDSTGFFSIWKWDSSDLGDSKDSESEEQIEEEAASEERETIKTTEKPIYASSLQSPYGDYDIDPDYEYADFYQNSEDNTKDYIEVSPYGTTENSLEDTSPPENPSTESSSTSTVSQDVEKIFESETTEATVTSSPAIKIYEFFSNDDNSEQSTDFYAVGSVADNLTQGFGAGPTPNGGESEDVLTSSKKNLEELFTQHDHELIEKYFRDLIARRISQVVSLDQQYADMEGDEYIDMLRGEDFEPLGPMPSTSSSDEWVSYISKRSVDTPSVLERRSGESLTPKELERKMVILQQSIDADNDFLQKEVSLTPEPVQHVLQEKLNDFYAKMETVSAHIDRLHERFLRLNKLDDDYISREFSDSENLEATSTLNN